MITAGLDFRRLLVGVFPIGLPVLIHDQLNDDELETHIGIVTKCHDPLCLADVYYGRISAVVVKGQNQIHTVETLEHFKHLISACYWVHLCDARVMSNDFANSWNAKEVQERIEFLMSSIWKEKA